MYVSHTSRRDAAIYCYYRTRHEGGIRGAEKEVNPGNLFRLGSAAYGVPTRQYDPKGRAIVHYSLGNIHFASCHHGKVVLGSPERGTVPPWQ
jgi:hypothetical protein